MEGQTEVAFAAPGRIRIRVEGAVQKIVEGARGSRWRVRISGAEPAIASFRIALGEISFSDKSGLAAELGAWKDRGIAVGVRTIGTVYGIRGQVVDNRRYLIVLDETVERERLAERQRSIDSEFGIRTRALEDVEREPSGSLELLDGDENLVAISKDRLSAEPLEGTGISVGKVEFGVGYDFHGFEDRSYRGALEISVDRRGKLAVVNLVSLEDLLKGLVPAEMFARAPIEALKAQAVTARGEVLAKIGTKHIGDPYLLCSEQHCAVYKGLPGEADSSTAAVEATRGEALFSSDHRLVDSVYSAVCGGHTEDNDVVWGGPADPNLRGKPDTLGAERAVPSPNDLPAFLSTEAPAACRLASLAQPGKYRWERRFTGEEVDQLTAGLRLGPVRSIAVLERGSSGRARSIEISGAARSVQIRGELNIRKLFGMLNSAMFIVENERSPDGVMRAFRFRGGGWGHGVGMCQLGAIGRAEAGEDYRAILRHYFSGAEVVRLY
jgi:stage II sporulation protein D